MKTDKTILTLILFFLVQLLNAQEENFGTRISLGCEKKLDNWSFSAEGEVRTIYYVRLISRGSLQLAADYKISKPFSVGAGYEVMNFLDVKYKDYQLRNRLYFQASGKYEWNRFTFSLREKIQLTTKDDKDRIKPNGKIDTYRIDPSWMSRTKLKVSYNINKSSFSPFVCGELNYQLNNPDGNKIDNIKVMLGTSYKLKKKHVF
ncbi:hypothetical protein DSECCO2_455190 [anaerobic digester metagenome]